MLGGPGLTTAPLAPARLAESGRVDAETTTPVVSVVMPVRNGGAFLAAALDSVLAQTGVSRELICIDDGSDDDTWRVLTVYAALHPDMLVRRATGSGISDALNQGIALARGRYIARMDADDVCLPDRLVIQARHLDRRPELGVLGTHARAIDADGTPRRRLRVPVGSDWVRTALETSSPLIHPTVMMRRDVVLAAGGYRNLFDGA
ncbi:MAG: hypothetical protein NVS2B11_09050 [Acetobacteraceae bacterium]